MAAQRRNGGQARNRKRSGRRSLPGWGWGLSGLALGLFVALVVHLEQDRPGPGLDTVLGERPAPSGDSGEPAAGGPDAARTQPDDSGTEGEGKPRFEFYKLLSEQEVSVPERDPERPRTPAAPPSGEDTAPAPEPDAQPSPEPGDDGSGPAQTAPDGDFLLQAGSFRRFADADRMKARLALLGVEAGIQSVELAGGETWHRVRAGPFGDRATVNDVRRRLRDNEIDAIMLKRGD